MTIIDELQEMQDYSELECQGEPEELMERIAKENVYQARVGAMYIDAKKAYREAVRSEICETVMVIAKQNYLAAKAQNALVESCCSEQAFIRDWAEQLYKTFTHHVDSYRSLLSFKREELRLRGTGY